MQKKSLPQATARPLDGKAAWHPPWASNGFLKPLVLASFLLSAIMLSLPPTIPTKFTTVRTEKGACGIVKPSKLNHLC